MPRILRRQRDLPGSSTYAAVAAAGETVGGKDQMDLLLVVALRPFGRRLVERCCWIQQMDLALQMDLGLMVLHKPVVVQLCMRPRRISC